MVKIPGLDDLKKIGSDLVDSAKTVNLSGMVDKFKSGIESVSKKGSPAKDLGDDPLGKLLQDTNATLNELLAAHSAEMAAIKKLQNQLNEMARVAAIYQKPTVSPTKTEEDNKT